MPEETTIEIEIQEKPNRKVFPFIDLRGLFVAAGIILGGLLLFAVNAGLALLGSTFMGVAIFVGLFGYACRYAGKPVLIVCPTYIKVFTGVTIMADKISRAELSKNAASVYYTGHFSETNEGVVMFRDVRGTMRDDAKRTLRAWLEEHDIPIETK